MFAPDSQYLATKKPMQNGYIQNDSIGGSTRPGAESDVYNCRATTAISWFWQACFPDLLHIRLHLPTAKLLNLSSRFLHTTHSEGKICNSTYSPQNTSFLARLARWNLVDLMQSANSTPLLHSRKTVSALAPTAYYKWVELCSLSSAAKQWSNCLSQSHLKQENCSSQLQLKIKLDLFRDVISSR